MVIPAIHLGSAYVAVTSGIGLGKEAKLTNIITVVAYHDNTQVKMNKFEVNIDAFEVWRLVDQHWWENCSAQRFSNSDFIIENFAQWNHTYRK